MWRGWAGMRRQQSSYVIPLRTHIWTRRAQGSTPGPHCLAPGGNTVLKRISDTEGQYGHPGPPAIIQGMQHLSLFVLLRNHSPRTRGNNWRQVKSLWWFLWSLDRVLNILFSTTALGDTTTVPSFHMQTVHSKYPPAKRLISCFHYTFPALPWELTGKLFQFLNHLCALSSHTTQNYGAYS